ncbi:probable amidase At4g34880 [Arachis stenosperma]|uniref:probable amidase At4g34880 n=1 Tax=Arachis stenosperma TaxID=217475 RepID=UPI0025AD8DC5|nr:probable amidase At4g34880 [Arachis stenosperma]
MLLLIRTVSDAVFVLDVISGIDYNDPATTTWSKYIPQGGFKQFLNQNGLKGKRLGIARNPFFGLLASNVAPQFEKHFQTSRHQGAVVVDNLQITNINDILNVTKSGEAVALASEFKLSFNSYLKNLVVSPVRSLADVIAFNQKNAALINEFGQDIFLLAPNNKWNWRNREGSTGQSSKTIKRRL